MGRWCFVTLGVKGGVLLTIFCIYRVCNQSVTTAGALTATRQQFNTLELRRGRTASTNLSCPRKQLPRDLLVAIKTKEAAGHLLMLCSDTNETSAEARYSDGSARPDTMEDLFDCCSLQDMLASHVGEVPTTSTCIPNRYIDKIMGSSSIFATAAGMLPRTAVKLSDHSPLYVDLDGAALLNGTSSPIIRQVARRLSVRNDLIVAKYLSYAITQAEYHRMEPRIDCLIALFLAKNRILSLPMRCALFNLDKQFVEVCLAADRQCSRIGTHDTGWSPEYQRAGRLVSYWKYRLRDPTFSGDAISRKIGKAAGLDLWEMDRCIFAAECKLNLTEAKAWLHCLTRDSWQYREAFQAEQADIASSGDAAKKLRILKAIRMSEKSKRAFRRIASALGTTKAGLSRLIVPTPDGSEETLFAKETIHDALATRNYRHYG